MNGQPGNTMSRIRGQIRPNGNHFLRHTPTRIPELILGCFVLFDSGNIAALSLPFAFTELAGAGLACLALARFSMAIPARIDWFQITLFAMASSILLTALATDSFLMSRMGHLAIWMLVAWGLAVGRIHMSSLARGMGFGVIIGVIYGLLNLGISAYVDRLTGLLGDPNTAGLYLIVGGCLSIAFTRRKIIVIIIGITAVAGIYLTGSRTSLVALGVVALWILFLGKWPRWISSSLLATGIIWFALSNSLNFAIGSFSDRLGSDILRQQIVAAENEKFMTGGFFGQGLGQGSVVLDDGSEFYFHSSYLASLVEFGWITTTIVVSVTAYIFFKAALVQPRKKIALMEAAIIAVAICAVNLGEAIYTIPTAIVLGMAVHCISGTRKTASR